MRRFLGSNLRPMLSVLAKEISMARSYNPPYWRLLTAKAFLAHLQTRTTISRQMKRPPSVRLRRAFQDTTYYQLNARLWHESHLAGKTRV
jgi:hypothetical protein